jgi:hypothetical protein
MLLSGSTFRIGLFVENTQLRESEKYSSQYDTVMTLLLESYFDGAQLLRRLSSLCCTLAVQTSVAKTSDKRC